MTLDNILIVASEKGILALDETGEKAFYITDSPNHRALCYHKGTLYCAGDEGVIELPKKRLIAERDELLAICSHNGKLYDSGVGSNVNDDRIKVSETLTNRFIAERENSSYALCSHEGKLYDGGFMDTIFDTLTGEVMATRSLPILTLCSHNGKLYDAGQNGSIFETFKDEEVAHRPEEVWALCSHNGTLLDAGNYAGIHETLGTRNFAKEITGITSMISIPKDIFQKLLKIY